MAGVDVPGPVTSLIPVSATEYVVTAPGRYAGVSLGATSERMAGSPAAGVDDDDDAPRQLRIEAWEDLDRTVSGR